MLPHRGRAAAGLLQQLRPRLHPGVVGTGVFGSGAAGLLLYLAHVAASLLVGVLFRLPLPGAAPPQPPPGGHFQAARFSTAFTRSVTGSLASALNICAFILFFTVTIRMLTLSGVLTGLARLLSRLCAPWASTRCGRSGCSPAFWRSRVSSLTGGALGRLSMAAFMLGWAPVRPLPGAGLPGDSGLSMGTYLWGKLLHGLISVGLLGLLTRLFPWTPRCPPIWPSRPRPWPPWTSTRP